MSKIYFENGENYHIKNEAEVSVIKYNGSNKIKIKNCSNRSNNLDKLKKISADEYVNTETGEICEYTKYDYKTKSSLCRSMKKLRELFLNNFNGGENEICLTLTFEKKEENFDKTVAHLNDFWKNLKKEFPDLEHISVIEKQEERNSWHIHMLIKDTKHKKLCISAEEIKRIWNKGIIHITKITNRNVKNLINDTTKVEDENSAIIKLSNYLSKTKSKEQIPANKKTYYKSRGIKFPNVDKMKYSEAQKILDDNNYCLLFERTLLIRSSNTDSILKKIKEEMYTTD